MAFRNVILFGLLLFVINIFAISEDIGTTGFSFLKVQFSARAVAMGNAYTGLANTSDAMLYNPAGIDMIKKKKGTISYINYFDGFKGTFASVTFPKTNNSSYALFSQYLGNSDITRTLADESGDYAGKDGTFGSYDVIFGGSMSRYINDILTLGINAKYIVESLDKNTASAIAFDIGLIHQTTNEKLKLGVTLKNVGKQLTYFTDSNYDEGLPTIVTVGFYYFPNKKINATADLYRPLAGDFSGRLGLEYKISPIFAIRGGYKTNSEDWKTDGDLGKYAGISGGFGILWKKINVDYALSSYGDLGFINQLSVTYGF